jgi:hypothetical protein
MWRMSATVLQILNSGFLLKSRLRSLASDARPDSRDAAYVDRQKRDEIRIHDVVLIWIVIGGHATHPRKIRGSATLQVAD